MPISSQTLPSIPRDDSEAAPDRPTGKIAQIGRVGLHLPDRGRSRTASARYHGTKTPTGREPHDRRRRYARAYLAAPATVAAAPEFLIAMKGCEIDH